jgi:Carboxypeptidase regulatory-like domain
MYPNRLLTDAIKSSINDTRLFRYISVIILMAALSLLVYGQGGSTSSLSGSVVDQTGAFIADAQITVKNTATNAEFRAVTAGNGTFSIPALDAGTYAVIVTAPGFKQTLINEVKVDVGTPATVRVALDVGSTSESVIIQGGGEMVQTQSANIATTLSVNQIANLPLVSRNPLNFIVLMPGVNTPGMNRDSTINGLPQSSIDITLDGINIQDNFNKTTDGFFTRVPPSIDSVQEVTVSTATPEAQGGAMGAVQIKFVTRQGSNELHGSAYWYHRNPALNSAYWFTNRDTTPVNDDTGLLCNGIQAPFDPDKCHAQRARVLFNQFGFRVGGPIIIPKLFNGRDKAFFFVNYEEFRQPSQVNRQRTILNPETQTGIFQYNAGGQVRKVNLLQLAAANGQTSTIDPVIGKLLADIRNATSNTGGITQLPDPNLQRFTYNPSGFNTNKRPTVRFDVNLTDQHHLEAAWTYLDGRGGPDFLNNAEPKFPGFPSQGSQPADRYTGSVALRSTLTPTLVNEVRAGLSGGPSRFNPEASVGDFSGTVANQGGFNLGGATGNNSTGIANAAGIDGATYATVNPVPSRRNPLLRDFSDTLTWTRGAHSLTFGGKFTQVNLTFNQQTLVPAINFGVNTNDPANAMFTTANFPGAAATDLNNARGIYAVVTGRVIAINANARLDEETGQYVYLGNGIERAHQREFGIFAQDSWRVRPNLTLNYGLRWEVQGAFTPLNSSYTTVSVADLWGVSGPGNLFRPGTLAGRATQFFPFREGEPGYNTDYKNLAPSFGFAWSPNAKSGWLKRIAGDNGQTVLRGGYSIAYNRQGIGDFRGAFSPNPGAIITTNRDLTIGNLVTNQGNDRLPVLLRETNRLGPPDFGKTPNYPLVAGTSAVPINSSATIYDPDIKVPYSQSWTFGIQREISKDMAIEVRYVGTRNLQNWITHNLNAVENNVLENGLLNEFKIAQANLRANIAAGRGNTFAYTGAPGTSPLPITLAHFSGRANPNLPSSYTSSNFTSSTFVNTLALNNPNLCCTTGNTNPSYSFSLDNNATFRANALDAGLPANFMLTNPNLRGGAAFIGNGGYTRYDAMQVDLRRRLSRGLLIQANYQFAKAFSSSRPLAHGTTTVAGAGNQFSFRAPRVNSLDDTTLRHAFKINWVYELPFGRGKMLFGSAGNLLNRLIGDWEFHGAGRIQSGQVLDFGSVNLIGMTQKDLRKVFKLSFDDEKGVVYSLPQDIIENTIRAFSTSATSPTGYGDRGAPTGRYIAPAGGPNCIQVYSGQCAPNNTYVTGPKFTRFDLSLVKRVKFTERFNFELRGEFLNAFNNINFFGIAAANLFNDNIVNPTFFSSQTFGHVTTAYTDSSNTQDPGGRLVQIVARFNF